MQQQNEIWDRDALLHYLKERGLSGEAVDHLGNDFINDAIEGLNETQTQKDTLDKVRRQIDSKILNDVLKGRKVKRGKANVHYTVWVIAAAIIIMVILVYFFIVYMK